MWVGFPGYKKFHSALTLLHLERPKLYTILVFLSALGLKIMTTLSGEATLTLSLLSPFSMGVNSVGKYFAPIKQFHLFTSRRHFQRALLSTIKQEAKRKKTAWTTSWPPVLSPSISQKGTTLWSPVWQEVTKLFPFVKWKETGGYEVVPFCEMEGIINLMTWSHMTWLLFWIFVYCRRRYQYLLLLLHILETATKLAFTSGIEHVSQIYDLYEQDLSQGQDSSPDSALPIT